MSHAIYSGLEMIFGGGLANELMAWMTTLFETLKQIFMGEDNLMGMALTLFAGIACSLLLIYFTMDIINQASRDMLSFEKLIMAMIKLFVAFMVLLFLKEIINGILSIGHSLYLFVSSDSFRGTIFNEEEKDWRFIFGDYEGDSFPKWSEVKKAFEDHYEFFNAVGLYMTLAIPQILGFVAKLAGYFITTSNAVMVIARAIFAPIAVVQLFEEGSRSAGIKYIKKFAAECITFAVIIVILYASTKVTNVLLENSEAVKNVGTTITFGTVDEVVTFGNLAIILLPELVAIGAMLGAAKITNDIIGTN